MFSSWGGGLVTKSCPTLVTLVAHQPPQSMGFSRQEYWIGLPFPSPGDLPDLGSEPGSPALQADSLLTELPGKPFSTYMKVHIHGGFSWGVDFSNIYSIIPGFLIRFK